MATDAHYVISRRKILASCRAGIEPLATDRIDLYHGIAFDALEVYSAWHGYRPGGLGVRNSIDARRIGRVRSGHL